jgi:hypothetical protein
MEYDFAIKWIRLVYGVVNVDNIHDSYEGE